MKSPLIKTLVMGLVALIASAVAAAFYPWPEPIVVSAVVGKPLFESYDTGSVRSIQITKYNDERNGLDQMSLRRSGEKWIIPDRKKFVASNPLQITLAANSMIDRLVLQETTDEQQRYSEFGVVDPGDYQNNPNRSGLGTKIILENRNGQDLASLIVGKQLKDDPTKLKHFVRIPGQPNVYVIDFNASALNTDFKSWVDPNLFQFVFPLKKIEVEIENYRINPEKIGASPKELHSRVALSISEQGVRLVSVDAPGADGQWQRVGMSTEINDLIQAVAGQMGNVQFTDVRKKSEELAALFKKPAPNADASLIGSLMPLGFVRSGFENGTYDFDSVGGEVAITTDDAVVVTLNIGTLADKTSSDDNQLSYYALMTAGVNEALIPEPEIPKSTGDANEDEKAFLRLVKARDEKVKSANTRASEINQLHADWVYVVAENVIENLRPDVDLSSAKPVAKPVATPAETEKDTELKKSDEANPNDVNSDKEKSDAANTAEEESSDKEGPAKSP